MRGGWVVLLLGFTLGKCNDVQKLQSRWEVSCCDVMLRFWMISRKCGFASKHQGYTIPPALISFLYPTSVSRGSSLAEVVNVALGSHEG